MNPSSNKAHRSKGRRKDKPRERHNKDKSKSKRKSRVRDRDRDRDSERRKAKKDREKRMKSDRKRRRSPSSNHRKPKHLSEESRRKRRKLNGNGAQTQIQTQTQTNTQTKIQIIHNGSSDKKTEAIRAIQQIRDPNLTFDIEITDNINAVKDIKNLVSNSKNKNNMNNIPAVLQQKHENNNIVTKTKLSTHGQGTVTIDNESEDASLSSYSDSDNTETVSDNDSSEYTGTDSDDSSDYSTDDSNSSTDKRSKSSVKQKQKHRSRGGDRDRHRNRHRNRDRERERSRKRDRNRARERERERESERERERDRNRMRDRRPRNNRRDGVMRGRTPNWLDHQEKEWFKAMEMLTKFNHRKNYRDKFLQVFEEAVYSKFKQFWHNSAHPTTQNLQDLETIFEKLYFEHFNSIRQVREYQLIMQRQQQQQQSQSATQTYIKPSQAQAQAPAPVQPQAQSTDLISMLNLGNDLSANIQNIQALLAMNAQQQQQQQDSEDNARRTLRVPARLQQSQHTQNSQTENIDRSAELPTPEPIVISAREEEEEEEEEDEDEDESDDDDGNMSVVTEDDIMMSSPMNDSKDENDSANSMSPEIAIDKSHISNSAHITAKEPSEDEQDLSFQQTLTNLTNFLTKEQTVTNTIQMPKTQISKVETAKLEMPIEIPKPDLSEPVMPKPPTMAKPIMDTPALAEPEMKTNSTNAIAAAVNPIAGIETSWLFSDESDLENSGNKLPGIPTANMAITNASPVSTNPCAAETAPSHYIPAPSYYNPPAPGQDIDRRRINADNSQLQPRRRAVRRRKPNQNQNPNMNNGNTEVTNALTEMVSKPKPRSPKKRGFFNRIRKQKSNSPPKMVRSTNNNNNNMIAGFHMDEANKPKLRKPTWNSMANKKIESKKVTSVSSRVSNHNTVLRKRNKHLIPKTKEKTPTIDLTHSGNNYRAVKHRLNKTRLIRKAGLKSKSNTPKSRSNTPNIPQTSNNSHSHSNNNSHKRVMSNNSKSKTNKSKTTTRDETIKRHLNMAPSEGRHFRDLGPRLEAPPTDLSALFDENPNKNKKKSQNNAKPFQNHRKASNNTTNNSRSKKQEYYHNSNSYPNPNPNGPYYAAAPRNNGPYYAPPPPPPPPPNGHYYPPPPPYYPHPPPPYGMPPPPQANGHYYPPAYGHGHGHMANQVQSQSQSQMPKYKKIAQYRDQIFFPRGYKEWSSSRYMEHIDNSIHGRTKLLLFLDIDHTILHSTRDKRGKAYLNHKIFGNDVFEINFPNQYNASYYIKFRPSFRQLIAQLSPIYDFVLYTMGSRPYAEQVAMVIDEHFRQFVPKSTSVGTFNKTFIIGNRIICREDHGSISDKEYKKNVSQFAAIKKEWCVVVDDVPEVWINRDDVHRVPKYLFWPNPDKTAPGTNHKHNASLTNNKVNIWSKNSITSWNDDKSLLKQENDSVLMQSIEIAKAIHECYYANYTPQLQNVVSAPQIYNLIRANVMKESHLVFTGVFPQKNAKNDFHWKLSQLFGANVSGQISNKTTHLIGKDSKTSKIQQAIKDGKIEIVHVNWLYQTLFNFELADCNKFRMFKNGDEKHTPPMHCHVNIKSKRELLSMYQNSA